MARPGFTEWFFNLVDARTDVSIDDSTGRCYVLTVNTPTVATIYSDDLGTSKTNALTFSGGVARWYMADTVTSVDLSMVTADGASVFIQGFTPSLHRVKVDPDKVMQTMVIPWIVGASGAQIASNFSLTTAMLVQNVYMSCSTLQTLGVMDFGTSTTPTGFIVGATFGATGWRCLDEATSAAAGGFIGALLATSATITLTSVGQRTIHVPANGTSGLSLCWQNNTATSLAGKGFFYLEYKRIVGF